MASRSGRLTQRDIARLAQVSQTTVSMVLNDRHVPGVRISQETRDRVLQVIRETGYVADPVARRMQAVRNQIIGVFTYERVFPSTSADFFHPFLVGIEERSEHLACDLLLFTSAPGGGGRRIFHENNRLRLADGCLLLGREIPAAELGRLNVEGYPFVAIGRRDDAGGPVAYVGAAYAEATADLVERVRVLGHREFAYLGSGTGPESAVDRWRGYTAAGGTRQEPAAGRDIDDLLDSLLAAGVTAALTEESDVAATLATAVEARGMSVPGDMSILALGDPIGAVPDREFSGFHLPRRAMGAQAVEVLTAMLAGDIANTQRLLPCEFVEGQTLGMPREHTQKGQ